MSLPLVAAAPLLCAGATTYSALRHYGLDKPGMKLGVIGLGGLGHMAVKFGKACTLQILSALHSGCWLSQDFVRSSRSCLPSPHLGESGPGRCRLGLVLTRGSAVIARSWPALLQPWEGYLAVQ